MEPRVREFRGLRKLQLKAGTTCFDLGFPRVLTLEKGVSPSLTQPSPHFSLFLRAHLVIPLD